MGQITYLGDSKILTCSLCAYCDYNKTADPCVDCSDNRFYKSHFKPHQVYQSILNSGACFWGPIPKPSKETINDKTQVHISKNPFMIEEQENERV